MSYRIVLVLTLIVSNPVARAGSVLTRDGKTLTGELSLTGSEVVVTPEKGEPKRVAGADVMGATLGEATAPNIEYAPARREKAAAAKGPARVLAEYFADRECPDRRLARYEPSIITYLDAKSAPDPA